MVVRGVGGGGVWRSWWEDTHMKVTVMFVECKNDSTSIVSKAEHLIQGNCDSLKRTRYILIYSVDSNSVPKSQYLY